MLEDGALETCDELAELTLLEDEALEAELELAALLPPLLPVFLTLLISKTISALGCSVKLIAETTIVMLAVMVFDKAETGTVTTQLSPSALAVAPLTENSFIIDMASFWVAKVIVALLFLTATVAEEVIYFTMVESVVVPDL